MTDAERQVCERIAVAMDYRVVPDGSGDFFNELGFPCSTPPNFFTSADAADALMRWLPVNGYSYRLYDMPEGQRCWIWKGGILGLAKAGEAFGDDWKTALANAADAAIQEAERVKD